MSRVILSPDPGSDLGQSSTASQGFIFYPNVTALRGANSIEQLATIGLQQLTLIEVVISGNIQFWQLQSGPGSGISNLSVLPLDYNAGTNNVNWTLVGGFGVNMMAAARVALVNTTQNIVSGVPTAMTFDTSMFNSGEWSSTVNPSRITAINTGIYAISGGVSFAANVTGQRKLELRVNGSLTVKSLQVNANSALVPTNLTVTAIVLLNAGDYVELIATQTSGSSLQVLQSANYSPVLSAVRLSAITPIIPASTTSSTPSTTTGVGNNLLTFTVASAGWYRIWSGPYPDSGNFNILRTLQADGQTSDTLVDFTITAGSPEGIITINRNSIPTSGSPSIDGVRISHDASVLLAYVEVHLTRGGTWNLITPGLDTNYLSAPFVVADVVPATFGLLSYALKPNVTGGTGTIDVPQINSGGNKLLAPNTGITWAAATGTPARTAFDTGTATLTQVAQRLKAVIDDLIAQGVFQVGIPASMIYTDMLALAASLVAENSVANVTDIFRVSVAVDTTVQGIYIPVGTFNGHNFYKIQGWEYEAAGQNSPRQCYWSTAWATWTISNLSGNLYHSGAAETNPWQVVQWKDQSSVNTALTTVAPNIPLTYNALTDTHTAMIITGSSTGYNGLYLRGADLNAKRRYYLVGTGSNNKRIEWNGSLWNIKDDSLTNYTGDAVSTFPDQVATWTDGINFDAIAVTGINAVDLMSGLTLGGNATYNGTYVPVQGAYNSLGGRKLIYRRTDGAYFIENDGGQWWLASAIGSGNISQSSSDGAFPWNATWSILSLSVQQNKIASPGWNNLAVQPNANITNNVIGNWHL